MTATHYPSLGQGIFQELLALENQLNKLYHPKTEVLPIHQHSYLYHTLKGEILGKLEKLLQREGLVVEELHLARELEKTAKKFLMELQRVEREYSKIRLALRKNTFSSRELKESLEYYIDLSNISEQDQFICFRSADYFWDNLLFIDGEQIASAEQTFHSHPDMIFYEPTPVPIILKMVQVMEGFFSDREEIFYDLGSGLARVPLLVHLLTGLPTVGVENNPFCHRYGRIRRDALGLEKRVRLINQDAREVPLEDGTIFFLYHPFEGEILKKVLKTLQQISQEKIIYIYSIGACSWELFSRPWLREIPFDDADHPGSFLFVSH